MTLRYNLQFFADGPGGEKTEPATAKKLDDARKKGQVAKSREIANGLILMALFLVLKFWVGHMGIQFLEVFKNVYSKIPDIVAYYNGFIPEKDILQMIIYGILRIIVIVAPIFLIAFLVAFISEIVQVKWKPSAQPMQPKFGKMNPISGFKKIFSANAVVELIKSIAKIGVILYITYSFLKNEWDKLFLLYDLPILQAIQLTGELIADLGIRIAMVYMVIALADYIYQKFKFSKDMRMSKQEVKEEYKNAEGDPQVKGKIKQKMREVSQRRMMQALPQADVVITNPTHYAVAIQYDAEHYEAPIVIAKGENYLAQKIKEEAREYEIEIVENKPLARMLYANVEIGQAVPPELYQAVAEVLAFVYHLKGKA